MHIKGTLHWSPSTVSFSLGLSPYLARATEFYISANARTSALKNLTLPNYKFEKGQYAFNPVKFSRIVEKKWSSSKMPKFYTGSNAFSTNKQFQKSKILLEGSGHPNFMNPFENGKSLMLILMWNDFFIAVSDSIQNTALFSIFLR